jgi:hypothetical protein
MTISSAVDQLVVARRRLADAAGAREKAAPGTADYRVAVRMLGAAWLCHRQAQQRVERMREANR